MMTTRTIDLTLTRDFSAPPKRVFALWADADHRCHWWAPKGSTCAEFTHDFRIGGTWQARLVGDESGNPYWMGGAYREISAPDRLVFTFAWLEGGVTPGDTSLITVTLKPSGNGTRQMFHHSSFDTEEARNAHSDGWSGVLMRLADALAA